jgi:DNA-binding LacI/PurR family transcriptional regulator
MPSAGEQLAEKLRAQIVQGAWTPGMRLPDRSVLASELGACLVTLQEAVAQLVDEGFLLVGPRKKGTRVADTPPHLSRYRVIFPFTPDDWGQFWHALEAAALQRSSPKQEFLPFYGLSGHRAIAEYQAVVHEVQTRQVAGLIFASSADELRGTPLLEYPGLPRVAIATGCQLPGIPKVRLDLDSLLAQAIDSLWAHGRRRIALLCASSATGMPTLFRRALAARGLPSRSAWEQFASLRNPHAARHLTELLLQSGQAERPDGLVIADDNLLTAASEGLIQAGVRVPDDLHVVAATNFPNLRPSAVPVTRIGFDIPAVLDLLVLRLQQVSRGETPPEHTAVPAIGETTASAKEY